MEAELQPVEEQVAALTGKARSEQELLQQVLIRQAVEVELDLAQKLEAVGRLAAGIAHEINTPIQYISDSVHFLGPVGDRS